MRALFSNLVAASLLIHAVVGCCWHHAHEAEGCDESHVALADGAGCCHHDHHGDAPQEHKSQGPCKGNPNCQGACTYLPAQKTQLDTLHSQVPIDFVAILPAMFDSQVATLRFVVQTRELVPGPPLRLHLLNQILLI